MKIAAKLLLSALIASGVSSALRAEPVTLAVVRSEPMFVAYPADAFARGVQGRVGVELQISELGMVQDCRVVEGLDQSLDAASCGFWKRARFSPARDQSGQQVASTLRKHSDWWLR